jgi:hypothetical protein
VGTLSPEAKLRADTLDGLVAVFAPRFGLTPEQDFVIGRPDLDVDKFFVAWNAAQLEGIVRMAKKEDRAYVAYLGRFDERLRCLLSIALKRLKGFTIRFVNPAWRYHSWGAAEEITRGIGISDARPVVASGRVNNFKIVTFVPEKELSRVRESMFSAGAGRYGLYSRCSFSSPGKGTFQGDKDSNPAYGRAGRFEEVDEERLEIMVPFDRLSRALSALRKVHPYEEPVIETYEIETGREFGEGRFGLAGSPVGSAETSRKIVSLLGSQPTYLSGDSRCTRIVVWDGDPERGLYEAMLLDADLYVGPDSGGLGRLVTSGLKTEVAEFPAYCFLLAGAKELVHMVREKSKRESWGLRTYLPSKVGREGVNT